MNESKNRKVCIVTGGNSGIGLMTAVGLAQRGAHVFIACRCAAKAEQAVSYIRSSTGNLYIEFLPLDLSSLDSVRTFVKLFLEKQLPLHVLVNNAGIFNTRGTTKEGFELIWGTNYLGHFLLTHLLMEKLKSSAPSRIIMVSSDLALHATSIKWDSLLKKTPLNFLELYAVSKLCLLLLTMELVRHLGDTNITVNAVHPGFVQSNITLGHRLSKYLGLGLSPQDGASSLVACATSSAFEGVNGKFFNHQQKEMRLPELANDPELAKQLWERSCLWTGCGRPKPATPTKQDATAEIWGPYSLALNNTEMAAITQTIFEKVLPNPPKKLLLFRFLSLGVKFQIGSLFLLLVQCWKKEFHMERHLDSDAVRALCEDDNLLQKLNEYLGEELVLWRSEIWVNYPSQQLIPFWHQDSYPKLLQGTGKTINIYMALTEVNECNGFEYIPTSLLTNDVLIKMTDPFSGNCFFELTEELERQAIPLVLRPGEFVLFRDQLIHRSIRNTTGQVRLALTLRLTEPNVRIVSSYSPI
jgi:NAD(P)-dependent dehydrogenase (short-subunit alcohol dehydrogenase family)